MADTIMFLVDNLGGPGFTRDQRQRLLKLLEDAANAPRVFGTVERAADAAAELDRAHPNNGVRCSSLELLAIVLATRAASYQDEFARRVEHRTSFAIKLGFVFAKFFALMFNIYTSLNHRHRQREGNRRSFIITTAVPNAKHVNYVLVDEDQVNAILRRCSEALRDRWGAANKTALEEAEILDAVKMRVNWEPQLPGGHVQVEFWEGRPPGNRQRRPPLLTRQSSEVPLLNCTVRKNLYGVNKMRDKFGREQLPVRVLAFLSGNNQRGGGNRPNEHKQTTLAHLAQTCAMANRNDTLIVDPSPACVFIAVKLALRLYRLRRGRAFPAEDRQTVDEVLHRYNLLA